MEHFLFSIGIGYNFDEPIPPDLELTIFSDWVEYIGFIFLTFKREIKIMKIEFFHDAKLHIIF